MKSRFASAVRQRRTELRLTQEELAWRAGVHRTYLASIESGARNPSLENIVKLARALEISIARLFANIETADPAHMRLHSLYGKVVEILLVEDNPRDVAMTVQALAKAGLTNRLHVARDGVEALDYLFGRGPGAPRGLRNQPHLILLDLNLPKVSGLEVLRRVKGDPRTRGILVAVLTVSQDDRDLAESRRLGAEAYISKPVDMQRLSEITPRLHLGWALLQPSERVSA